MKNIVRLSETASWVFSVIGGFGAVAAMAMITIDVLLRMVGSSLPGTYEITVNYFMLLIAFLPLMRVEWLDQMITIEVVYTIVSNRVKMALLLFAGALTFVVYVALTYVTWIEALQKMRVGSYVVTMGWAMPTWPGYFVLPLAFLLSTIAVLVRFIQRATGDLAVDAFSFDPEEEGRKLAAAGTTSKGQTQ